VNTFSVRVKCSLVSENIKGFVTHFFIIAALWMWSPYLPLMEVQIVFRVYSLCALVTEFVSSLWNAFKTSYLKLWPYTGIQYVYYYYYYNNNNCVYKRMHPLCEKMQMCFCALCILLHNFILQRRWYVCVNAAIVLALYLLCLQIKHLSSRLYMKVWHLGCNRAKMLIRCTTAMLVLFVSLKHSKPDSVTHILHFDAN